MKDTHSVIADIKELVKERGYIYALCMIISEDFYIKPKELQKVDHVKALSVNEISLLLGFLIQEKINYLTPHNRKDVFDLCDKTYELMNNLQESCTKPFYKRVKTNLQNNKIGNSRKAQKEVFGKGDVLMEEIFYSGTGSYDFQYLDFLERRYKYDKKWLSKFRNFNIEKTKFIVSQIKNIGQSKVRKYIDNMNRKPKTESSEISYRDLIELFVIRKSDFPKNSEIDSFLENFSISFEENINAQFQGIGSFNLISEKPIIKLDEDRYFVPVGSLVCEAVYESPFYWMFKGDKAYRNQLSRNRGETGEEITYIFLSRVFSKEKTYRSVKVASKKGQDVTNIDVLCILGSKALCIQVKSKKLTEQSRAGYDGKLQKDFKGAVQDSYEQGLVARQKILARNARFFKRDNTELILSEGIDEVYIMGVTIENYPLLAHQAHVMLDKEHDDPFPIFVTIFDLEVMIHHLKDPYDFLHYIKQRISLMDCCVATEELVFLGSHLCERLLKTPEQGLLMIDQNFRKLIDRNHYPFRTGTEISDKGDGIESRWKNEDFDKLCAQLKTFGEPKITDVVFHLLDLSEQTNKNITDFIIQTKQKTLVDGKIHDFSILPDEKYSPRVGITYISLNSDNSKELIKILQNSCSQKKYKINSNVWIGFGSLKSSTKIIDVVAFDDRKWEYDQKLEELSKNTKDMEQAKRIRIDKSGKSVV